MAATRIYHILASTANGDIDSLQLYSKCADDLAGFAAWES